MDESDFCESCCKRRRALISMRESKHRALPSFFEVERERDVLGALDAIEADVTLARPVRWRELLPVIRGMTVIDETAPDCLNVAKALLGLFERYHCRDMRVMFEVFRLLLSLTNPDHPVLNYDDDDSIDSIDFTDIFLSPYGEGQTVVDLVYNAAVRGGNLSVLKLQLKFGLGMVMSDFSHCCKNISIMLHIWPPYSFDDDTDENSVGNPRVRERILRGITAEKIEEDIRCNFNPEFMKRLDLIFRMMALVRGMKVCRPDCRERFAECYRLLFDSIPEAFVTSVEVKAFLEKFLPASCSRLISTITEDFKNLLPDLPEVPQPRSLKHSCRIQVRQSLRRNLNLPHGVPSLPLPSRLKKYITLNDDGDYSVVIRSPHSHAWRAVPDSYISIPERDDCVTSFLKNL